MKGEKSEKALTVVLCCNPSRPYGERLWDKFIPHCHACTTDSDSPATDGDANANRYHDTYPANRDANADPHRDAHPTNPHAHPADANVLASHRHRVCFRLRLYHHPGRH